LGTCNINAKFDLKPIELIVTTYQVYFGSCQCLVILTCLMRFDMPYFGRLHCYCYSMELTGSVILRS
jgi:hypothetical protein